MVVAGRMSRRRLLTLAVVLIPILVIGGSILVYDSTSSPRIASSPNIHFTGFSVNGKTFQFTYVATTQPILEHGLMDTNVTSSTTMLFVFPNASYFSFWMLDVNTPLDMIWIYAANGSSVGRVVYLALDTPPCYVAALCPDYTPTAKANFVIEGKAGFAAANGIEVGSTVTFHQGREAGQLKSSLSSPASAPSR